MPASTIPRFRYDPGTGDIDIVFTSLLQSDPKQSPEEVRGSDHFGGTGVRQRNLGYNHEIIVLRMEFVTRTTMDLVDTMLRDHVNKGGTFTFFPDETDLLTFTKLQMLGFRPDDNRRQFPARIFYTFTLTCRVEIS